jgi:MvdC family ATP-grasp ribosomal peptide maturase
MPQQLNPSVLLVTHSADYFTVDRVAEALLRQGVRPFRLDTDLFPQQVQLSTYIDGAELHHKVDGCGQSFTTEEVRAVWLRRIWTSQLSENLKPQFRAVCARESMAALEGFLDGLAAVRWVDSLPKIRQAENKLYQLRVARSVGLRIPRTLVTNDAKRVRTFFQELKGVMVAKLLTPVSVSMDGSSPFVYTNAVREEDLDNAEALCHSPMVFQERIPKQRELRVAFVGGTCFVGALNSAKSIAGQVDWRRASLKELEWEPEMLPNQVTYRLKALMAELGLVYGAIDLILTPDGEYVFLEVNPTGEWGMLERDLGYPISDAIARTLLA